MGRGYGKKIGKIYSGQGLVLKKEDGGLVSRWLTAL